MLVKRLAILSIVSLMIFSGCTNQDEVDTLTQEHEMEIEQLQGRIVELEGSVTANQELIKSHEGQIKSYESSIAENDQVISDLEDEIRLLETDKTTLSEELEEALARTNATPSVVDLATDIMTYLKLEDFASLATHVHPIQGVRLTPYPYIDLANDIVMTAGDMANFSTSAVSYSWGFYDGSGDPIVGIPMTYYDEFIYDHDFVSPDMMSWNSPIGYGNMINNLTSIYPSADYVEFHFTGFNPAYSGMDWSSLTLVFEQVGSTWYLVGIVHGQWTT